MGLFDKMQNENIVSWNLIILETIIHGYNEETL